MTASDADRDSNVRPIAADHRQLPETEEVYPGIWSLPIAMPGPLGFICCYAIEYDNGLLLIDAGWDGAPALEALVRGLSGIGADLSAVRGILFTHGHRDHYGVMRWLRPETRAWTALHQNDVTLATNDRLRLVSGDRLVRWLVKVGSDTPERNAIASAVYERTSAPADYPEPDRALADGDEIEVANGTLAVIHTPGHTPGHVSFIHEQAEVVFTGDHILSHTTPHVGIRLDSSQSPLDDYLHSLKRVERIGGLLALPGHEERVPAGLRAAELLAHHDDRLAEVRNAVEQGNETVREITEQMTWWSPWESYGPLDRFMALTEALAHIVYLARRGELTCDERYRWRADPNAAR